MKVLHGKKRVFAFVIIVLIIVAGFLWGKHANCLGVLKDNISTPETSGTAFTFTTGEIKRIKLKYKALVNQGSVCFTILDSNENVIFMTDEFDSKIEEEKIIDFDKVDEYTVEAKYENYEGSFKLVAYKIKSDE